MADFLWRWENLCQRALGWLGARYWASAVALLLVTLATYLPGVVNLPPVDRTEVIYAESTRDMVAEGRWTAPRYVGERDVFRPIGTFWLQAASARLFGSDAARQISVYRLPSLVGVLVAIFATYGLLFHVIGGRQALIAGLMVALSPISALQANLAVTEGIAFGPAVLAQFALMRVYLTRDGERTLLFALVFWLAEGIGILLNAFAVPILSIATLVTLGVMDRRLDRLMRLKPWLGVPLALLVASPWPIELWAVAGGNPYTGMSWHEFWAALGGSQSPKFGAPPLSFVLGFVAGMLPVALLLWPALRRLWDQRLEPVSRFLLAWIVGYLGYLELISSKPALYTVQALFPPAAAAIALLLAREGKLVALRLPSRIRGWPGLLFAALVPVLYITLHHLLLVPVAPASLVSCAAIAALLAIAAASASADMAALWLTFTFAGFSAFLSLTFGGLLPRLETVWTSQRMVAAIDPLRPCIQEPVAIVGITEPSMIFTFGAANVSLNPRAVPSPALTVVHAKQDQAYLAQAKDARPIACIETVNFTRGCIERFTTYTTKDLSKCHPEPLFVCERNRRSSALPGKACY